MPEWGFVPLNTDTDESAAEECPNCGTCTEIRYYPDLTPPALFYDCHSCRCTWEGKL
jgi:hypothetical protein